MTKLIASFILIEAIAIGCAPTQPFVPAFPMEKGRAEIRFSIGYSTCKAYPFSFQMGGWLFVSDRDAIGATATNILFFPWPAVMSYAHYWPTSDNWINAQIHKTILPCQNPLVEADIGYAHGSWNWQAASRVGLGIYADDLRDSVGAAWHKKVWLMPIVGLQYRNEYFVSEAEMIYGYSKRAVERADISYPPQGRDSLGEFKHGIIPRSEILSVEKFAKSVKDSGWYVHLDSGKTVVISTAYVRFLCGMPLFAAVFDNPFENLYRPPGYVHWWVWETK